MIMHCPFPGAIFFVGIILAVFLWIFADTVGNFLNNRK